MANLDGHIVDSTTLFANIRSGDIQSSQIGIFHAGIGTILNNIPLFNSVKTGYAIPQPPAPLVPNHILGYIVNPMLLFSSIKAGYINNSIKFGISFIGQKLDKRFKFIGL